MDTGDKIQDRYELASLLGRGGMAEVWRARDNRLNRFVAVKLLGPGLAGEPNNLVRFFREAQSVAGISHPNVVTVLDFGEHGARPYLVMEYAPGGSLADVTGTPMDPDRARDVVAKIAAGAGAAHARGIVHRDIKPANVLLDQHGNPKLADFGIAAAAGGERLTATGTTVGSPHYISPEQAAGSIATPASDVYSLGVVLYELLTGHRPFEDEGVMAVLVAHVEREPPAPSTHVIGLDPALEALVMRCLSKEPAERFAAGDELSAALSGGAPETAVMGTEIPDKTLVATGAVPAHTAPRPPATSPEAPPHHRSRGARVALLVSGLLVLLLGGAILAAALLGSSPDEGNGSGEDRGPRSGTEQEVPGGTGGGGEPAAPPGNGDTDEEPTPDESPGGGVPSPDVEPTTEPSPDTTDIAPSPGG
jgi:eukaryotic-like serine/threonine-protein kinase